MLDVIFRVSFYASLILIAAKPPSSPRMDSLFHEKHTTDATFCFNFDT